MTDLKSSLAAHKKALLAVAAALLALAAAAGVWWALQGRAAAPESSPAPEKTVSVRTIAISPTAGDVALRYTGLVQPGTLTQVAASTIGEITKLYVAEGDEVTAGQLLAQLDDSGAVRQAESYEQVRDTARRALESAQASRDRAAADYAGACGGASESELSEARGRLDDAVVREQTAQAELDRINAALAEQQEKVNAAQAAFEAAQSARDAAAAASEAANAALEQAQAALKSAEEAGEDTTAPQQAVDAANGQKAAADAALAQAEEELAAARAARETALADYAAAQTSLGLAAAQTELTAAQSERAAAQTAYDALAARGSGSAEARAQKERLDAAETALAQAQTSYDTAQRNYDAAKKAIDDCKLRAGVDGYVVTVVASEGGLATPLAPVLVLGSRDMVARFGVSQSDVRELEVGMPASVTLDGRPYDGSITAIAVLPDETTRTYPVDVAIGADFTEVYLGSMASVELQLGQRTGVWLPLSVILNDGEDYVYLVEEGRAVRRNVGIAELSNDMVLVTGLAEGGQVISEGMKTVRSGSPVRVLGAGEG